MNPGPSNSTTTNIVPITAGIDSSNSITAVYGSGPNQVDQLSFCKAILAQYNHEFLTVPSGVAPTGSIGNNGALTLGTALDAVYGPTGVSPGIYLYFPANAIYTGSLAGSYWCVMTTTTAGTIYQNTYSPPGSISIPSSPTPFTSTGPGAYTGVTTEVAVHGITIPANAIGANGGFEKITFLSFNNTANVKTGRIRFGGMAGTIYDSIAGTNNASASASTFIVNRGTGFQIGPPSIGYGLSTSAPITSTVDTTLPVVVLTTLQLSTATDWMVAQFSKLTLDSH